MSNETKHTPGPWVLEYANYPDEHGVPQGDEFMGCITHPRPDLGEFKCDYVASDLSEADAQHIVRCVNLFPDMLDALRHTLVQIERLRGMNGYRENNSSEWVGPVTHEIEDKVLVVINKAEGRE